MQPKIIIPTRPRSLAQAKQQIAAAEKAGDIVEVWLDGIADLDQSQLRALISSAKKPLLVNLKDAAEQGSFALGAKKRLEILAMAAKAGAAFVDLPLTLSPAYLRGFREQLPRRTQLILSWHDFGSMPTLVQLRRLATRAMRLQADIVKLVGTAHEPADCLPILQITSELVAQRQAVLTMAMGAAGQLTRVLTPLLGGFAAFGARTPSEASAPGQLTAAELRDWWRRFSA